jgi:hypothetical protein
MKIQRRPPALFAYARYHFFAMFIVESNNFYSKMKIKTENPLALLAT